MLIYGDREVICAIEISITRARKLMKNLDVAIIPNANHLTATSNASVTNESILAFLENNG